MLQLGSSSSWRLSSASVTYQLQRTKPRSGPSGSRICEDNTIWRPQGLTSTYRKQQSLCHNSYLDKVTRYRVESIECPANNTTRNPLRATKRDHYLNHQSICHTTLTQPHPIHTTPTPTPLASRHTNPAKAPLRQEPAQLSCYFLLSPGLLHSASVPGSCVQSTSNKAAPCHTR